MPSKPFVLTSARLIGSSSRSAFGPVSMSAWLIRCAVPCIQMSTGSFFRDLPPLQSSFASSLPPGHLSVQALPTKGLVPHRDISRRVRFSQERSHAPTTFRPQTFSASRRFTPRSTFAGLFHPADHVQGSTVQGLLSRRHTMLLVAAPFPPCRFISLARQDMPNVREIRPRLRGFCLHRAALTSVWG